MDKLEEKFDELSQIPQVIQNPQEFSEIFVGRTYGYFEILKKAGRNRNHQQRYIARCKSCQQLFTKTLYEIKKADGESVCKHTHRTAKPAVEPHPCANCGEMTTNLKYCTARCKAIAINKETKTKPLPTCVVCGKETPSRTAKFCGNECRRLHRIKAMYGIEINTDRQI